MKKKMWIAIVVVALFIIFIIPIPTGIYKDGGTRTYTSLTYMIVDWNRMMTADDIYDATKVYFFPHNFKSIDSLWDMEENKIVHSFRATVLEFKGSSVLVQPVEGESELRSSDKISFGTTDLEEIDAEVGSVVEVSYTGGIMESYPAQISATSWKLSDDLRHMEYTEHWLDKMEATKHDKQIFDHIRITKIYSNCFFAKTVIPMPYEIKLNGTLSDEWCVGDQISCTYENTYYDDKNQRIEADMLTVEASDWEPDPNVAYKPVIYLYPEKETEVSVKLTLDGELICTYPAYESGWDITAYPDGTLSDAKGQSYNYLYWEGEISADWDFTEGFCIPGKDTALFLEDALEKMGLTRREANEFIIYWLPLMEQNPYNIISFQTDMYTEAAQLEVVPTPDTMIRVFMTWQASDRHVVLTEQELNRPDRSGFTVVEWGGTKLK